LKLLPGCKSANLYGPVETIVFRYLAPVSVSLGTGIVCGSCARYSKAANGFLVWNTIVYLSGVSMAESVFMLGDL